MTSEFPDIELTCPQPSFVSSLLTQCEEKSEAAALRDEQSLFSQGALWLRLFRGTTQGCKMEKPNGLKT